MTDDLFRRSTNLDKELAKLRKDPQGTIQGLLRGGLKNRRHIHILYATVALVGVLGVILLLVALRADHAARRADHAARAAATNAQVLYRFCVQGNELRADVRDAIKGSADINTEGLIAAANKTQATLTPAKRAEQERAIAAYRADIERRVSAKVALIHDRDCSKLPGAPSRK